MSILVPERASVLSGLDSAAIADGRAPSAHLLRELARNANRMISRGELVARLSFDAGGTAGESMGADDMHGWGTVDRWVPITHAVPIERNPWLVSYRALVTSYLEEDSKLYLEVETSDHPHDPAAGPSAANVITLDGDAGSDTWVSDAKSIAVAGRRSDFVRLWLRSEILGAMDTVEYGSPASGTLTGLSSWTSAPGGLWTLEDSGATWDTSGSTPTTGGHLVRLLDVFGNVVVPWTRILVNTGTTFSIKMDQWAGIPFGNGIEWVAAQQISGCDYEIVKTPVWRLGDFALYAEARTP
jgi:hypothetical protein